MRINSLGVAMKSTDSASTIISQSTDKKDDKKKSLPRFVFELDEIIKVLMSEVLNIHELFITQAIHEFSTLDSDTKSESATELSSHFLREGNTFGTSGTLLKFNFNLQEIVKSESFVRENYNTGISYVFRTWAQELILLDSDDDGNVMAISQNHLYRIDSKKFKIEEMSLKPAKGNFVDLRIYKDRVILADHINLIETNFLGELKSVYPYGMLKPPKIDKLTCAIYAGLDPKGKPRYIVGHHSGKIHIDEKTSLKPNKKEIAHSVHSLTSLNDNSLLVASYVDGTIRLWDLKGRKNLLSQIHACIGSIPLQMGSITALTKSSPNSIVVGTATGNICELNTDTMQVIWKASPHSDKAIKSLAVSSKGQVFSAGEDGRLSIWKGKSLASISQINKIATHHLLADGNLLIINNVQTPVIIVNKGYHFLTQEEVTQLLQKLEVTGLKLQGQLDLNYEGFAPSLHLPIVKNILKNHEQITVVSKDPTVLMESGVSLLEIKGGASSRHYYNPDRAMNYFEQALALQKFPIKKSYIYTQMSLVEQHRKAWQASVNHCFNAIELDESRSDELKQLFNILVNIKDFNRLDLSHKLFNLTIYQTCLIDFLTKRPDVTIVSNDPEVLFICGEQMQKMRDYKASLNYFELGLTYTSSIRDYKNGKFYSKIAFVKIELKKIQEAIHSCFTAIGLEPTRKNEFILLLTALVSVKGLTQLCLDHKVFNLRDYQDGLIKFLRSKPDVTIISQSSEVLYFCGEQMAEQGRFQQALSYYEQGIKTCAAENAPPAKFHSKISRMKFQLNQFQEAFDWCFTSIELDATRRDELNLLFSDLASRKSLKALNLRHKVFDLQFYKKSLLDFLNNNAQVTILSDDTEVLFVCGEHMQQMGKFLQSLSYFEAGLNTLVRNDIRKARFYSKTAQVKFELARFQEAINDCLISIKLEPKRKDELAFLFKRLETDERVTELMLDTKSFELGLFEKSLVSLVTRNENINIVSNDPLILIICGTIKYNLNQKDRAEVYYLDALNIAKYAESYINFLSHNPRLSPSFSLIQESPVESKEDTSALTLLPDLSQPNYRSKVFLTFVLFRELFKQFNDENRVIMRCLRAKNVRFMENVHIIRKLYQTLLTTNPKDIEIYLWIGQDFIAVGDLAPTFRSKLEFYLQARNYFQKGFSIEPSNQTLANALDAVDKDVDTIKHVQDKIRRQKEEEKRFEEEKLKHSKLIQLRSMWSSKSVPELFEAYNKFQNERIPGFNVEMGLFSYFCVSRLEDQKLREVFCQRALTFLKQAVNEEPFKNYNLIKLIEEIELRLKIFSLAKARKIDPKQLEKLTFEKIKQKLPVKAITEKEELPPLSQNIHRLRATDAESTERKQSIGSESSGDLVVDQVKLQEQQQTSSIS